MELGFDTKASDDIQCHFLCTCELSSCCSGSGRIGPRVHAHRPGLSRKKLSASKHLARELHSVSQLVQTDQRATASLRNCGGIFEALHHTKAFPLVFIWKDYMDRICEPLEQLKGSWKVNKVLLMVHHTVEHRLCGHNVMEAGIIKIWTICSQSQSPSYLAWSLFGMPQGLSP